MRCENCRRDVAGVYAPYGGMVVCGRASCLWIAYRIHTAVERLLREHRRTLESLSLE